MYTVADDIPPLPLMVVVVLKAVPFVLTSKPGGGVTNIPPEIFVPETVKLSTDDDVP